VRGVLQAGTDSAGRGGGKKQENGKRSSLLPETSGKKKRGGGERVGRSTRPGSIFFS
jgi:hypothetical protein